ncbi:putative B3 domain-containing protein At5g58280 [Vicia villosa]|uniref:putative B3 domain-containing protein At5g58280 n=1 Tax=Vicia villosa TaxID=3911 RepID=UPI00273C6484|nr:putative B3 domain-containing protein At5g58280 [Vicia villosa]
MAKGSSSNNYEEARKLRLEQNNKKFQDLGISMISKQLTQIASFSNKSPKRCLKQKSKTNDVSEQRRSSRARNKVTSYTEEFSTDFPHKSSRPRKRSRSSPSSWGSYIARPLDEIKEATKQERDRAYKAAEKLESNLQSPNPSFVKSMVRSHVYSCFWLGLPSRFCLDHLPKEGCNMILEDEEGSEYAAVYIGHRSGLSGGWRAFALEHKLDDGDALVFELVKADRFKIYIVRAFPNIGEKEEEENDTLVEEETTHTIKATKKSKAASNLESASKKTKKRKHAIETKESENSEESLPESNIDKESKPQRVHSSRKTKSSQKKMQKISEVPSTPEQKEESQIEVAKPKEAIQKTRSSQRKLQKISEVSTTPEPKGEAQVKTMKPKEATKLSRKSKEGNLSKKKEHVQHDAIESMEDVKDDAIESTKDKPDEKPSEHVSQKPPKKRAVKFFSKKTSISNLICVVKKP